MIARRGVGGFLGFAQIAAHRGADQRPVGVAVFLKAGDFQRIDGILVIRTIASHERAECRDGDAVRAGKFRSVKMLGSQVAINRRFAIQPIIPSACGGVWHSVNSAVLFHTGEANMHDRDFSVNRKFTISLFVAKSLL